DASPVMPATTGPDSDPRVVSAPDGSLQFLTLDTRHGPFRNRWLRLAPNRAVHPARVAAVAPTAPPQARAADLPSPIAAPGAALPFPIHADIATAKSMIHRSGVRPPIAVSLWYFDFRPEINAAMAEVKRDLDAAGFAVTLRPVWGDLFFRNAAR